MRTGLWLLSLRHLQHHKLQTGILVSCIALSAFLPVTTQVLAGQYETDLKARARATPLVLGTRGNATDLTLCALYFRLTKLEPVPFAKVAELQATGHGLAVPVSVRHTAQKHPVVGVSAEYFERRRLRPAAGTLPLMLGDCVLGADVARQLGKGVGDAIHSDATDVLDIAAPTPLKMKIVGVLPATKTPDDAAVFVDIGTCWILEGAAHGHVDADKLKGNEVLGKRDGTVAVSPAMKPYQEVTEDNLASFHVHGDEGKLPLSGVLFFPKDDRSRTLLATRVNETKKSAFRFVAPTQVIDELMAVVFKVKALLDAFAVLLAIATGAMLVLQVLLSMKLRSKEMLTLERMGCSPGTVGRLYATEVVLVVLVGFALAVPAVWAATRWTPDLVRVF